MNNNDKANINALQAKLPVELVLISGFFCVKHMWIVDSPQWLMELTLISGFFCVKQMRIFDSPQWFMELALHCLWKFVGHSLIIFRTSRRTERTPLSYIIGLQVSLFRSRDLHPEDLKEY